MSHLHLEFSSLTKNVVHQQKTTVHQQKIVVCQKKVLFLQLQLSGSWKYIFLKILKT